MRVLTLPLQAHHAMEKMEEFVYKVWERVGTPWALFWGVNEAQVPHARGWGAGTRGSVPLKLPALRAVLPAVGSGSARLGPLPAASPGSGAGRGWRRLGVSEAVPSCAG